MKTETLECVTQGELRRQVAKLVGKHGNQYKAADELGISQSMVGLVLRGASNLGRKIPAHFGLVARTVYVKKGAANGK